MAQNAAQMRRNHLSGSGALQGCGDLDVKNRHPANRIVPRAGNPANHMGRLQHCPLGRSGRDVQSRTPVTYPASSPDIDSTTARTGRTIARARQPTEQAEAIPFSSVVISKSRAKQRAIGDHDHLERTCRGRGVPELCELLSGCGQVVVSSVAGRRVLGIAASSAHHLLEIMRTERIHRPDADGRDWKYGRSLTVGPMEDPAAFWTSVSVIRPR